MKNVNNVLSIKCYVCKGLEELSLVTRASCSSNMGKIHISVIVDTITSQTVSNVEIAK